MRVRTLVYSGLAHSADDKLGGLSAKINDVNGLVGHGMLKNIPDRRFRVVPPWPNRPAWVPVLETTDPRAVIDPCRT